MNPRTWDHMSSDERYEHAYEQVCEEMGGWTIDLLQDRAGEHADALAALLDAIAHDWAARPDDD